MKLLITGATGFIGRHVLAEVRQNKSLEVSILARNPHASFENVETIVGTIDEAGPGWDALGKPDMVIDLAWNGLPNYHSPHHFEEARHHSIFLRRLAAQGLKRIVCAGTCFEYGMQQGQLDEDQVTNPVNSYGIAKDMLRRQLELQCNKTQLVWARFFYLYGDGQSPTSLYSQVCAAIKRGDTTFPMSCGEQLRDFMPVKSAAKRLIELALTTRIEGTYNIASGEPISVRRLVEKWFSEANKNVDLDLGKHPYPDWEPFAFWGSNVKLSNALAMC